MDSFSPASCQVLYHNFWAKITNRNGRKNGIKICQWNAGGGFLLNKQEELSNIIDEFRPHVFGITESSFKRYQNKADVKIQDYEIFFSNTLNNPNLELSRACVYVHKDLNFKLRDDLMNDTISSVWLELGKPRQKKVLFCVFYREWQYVNQQNDSSHSVASQLERWCIFLEQWEKAISFGVEK